MGNSFYRENAIIENRFWGVTMILILHFGSFIL